MVTIFIIIAVHNHLVNHCEDCYILMVLYNISSESTLIYLIYLFLALIEASFLGTGCHTFKMVLYIVYTKERGTDCIV